MPQQVFNVKYAGYIVEVIFIDRYPGVSGFPDDFEQVVVISPEIDGDDVDPGGHDLLHADLAEFDNAFQDVNFLFGAFFLTHRQFDRLVNFPATRAARLGGFRQPRFDHFCPPDKHQIGQAEHSHQESKRTGHDPGQVDIVDLGVNLWRYFAK